MNLVFNEYNTRVVISRKIPILEKITSDIGSLKALIIADENTCEIADKVCGNKNLPRCILKSTEENKNWASVQAILSAAHESTLDRDSVFIGIGGGMVGDLTGFAASIYKRGCRLILVPTTLLAMVDASIGGKTGFDIFGIKNLAGSFFPAEIVYMPVDCLSSLPVREWKNGIAELIKTAVLSKDTFLEEIAASIPAAHDPAKIINLQELIKRAVMVKGSIAGKDFRESGQRMLLNLGHTFGHALEAAAGLGNVTHGDAVAWGIVRACELGYALGITPASRAKKIIELIKSFGYDVSCPHPLSSNEIFYKALMADKKKRQGKLAFIVPDENSAVMVIIESKNEIKILEKIIMNDSGNTNQRLFSLSIQGE